VLASCHLHSQHGMAWAAFGEPLAPINQTACYFYESQAVITEGAGQVALEDGAGRQIATALGSAKIAIHQNHGLFAVGRESVDEAAWWFLSAERACAIQLQVDAAGRPPRLVPHDKALHIARNLATPGIAWLHFQPHYDAICRSDPDLFD
jgi:ribulose-5-phosphate 4-epimerase/fuculose-1-phosphate aldolase